MLYGLLFSRLLPFDSPGPNRLAASVVIASLHLRAGHALGLLALLIWRLSRVIRWGIVLLLIGLQATQLRAVSRALAKERTLPGAKLLWGLGSTLVASLGILFSVTYMDQMQIVWYFLLASIAVLTVRPALVPLTVLPDPVPARRQERVDWRKRLNSRNVAV
jgi:hypothetical protein